MESQAIEFADSKAFEEELYRFVLKKSAKVAREEQALIESGVKKERIVYILRNVPSTWGDYREDFESFVGELLSWHIEVIPVGGYPLEASAVNGDDFMLVFLLLKKVWDEEPEEWAEYKRKRAI